MTLTDGRHMSPEHGRLSVIIPARNDVAALRRTLNGLQQLAGMEDAEILVAASGGDMEKTVEAIADRAGLLWPGVSTRAGLMNAAAQAAHGDVLFFLHADSLPPAGAVAQIRDELRDPRVVGGAFEHRFEEAVPSLKAISWINRRRYRMTQNYYGDQGIFVRTAVFRALGGYRDMALLEDLDLSRRLKRAGRTVLIRSPLITSGRRFLERGPWRTFGFCLWLLLLHTLRLDTQHYSARWRGPEHRAPGSAWQDSPLRSRSDHGLP